MNRVIGLASLALIAVLGCGKGGGESSAPAQEQQAAPAAPAENKADDSKPAPEQKLLLDAAKAKAFVGYQEKWLGVMAENSKAAAALSDKAGASKGGVVASIQLTNDASKQGTHLSEQLAALRKEFSLSEAELTALASIQSAVLMRSSPLHKQMASQAAQLEKQMPAIPAQMRAEAESGLKGIKDQVAAIESMKESRDAYGDAIVDAMLAEAPTLAAQVSRIGKPQ